VDAKGCFEAEVVLAESALIDVQWWADNIMTAICPLSFPDPHFVVTSDASQYGWGAWCADGTTGGDWTDDERNEHINWKELKGAFLALLTFCSARSNCHIRLMLDNTTAIACIQKYGSMKPKLLHLTKQIYEWASDRNVHLSAAHIPGRLNVQADKESRTHNVDTEWCIKDEIFDRICDTLGRPDIDLFASRINNRLPRYVSWRPDPFAENVDAFQMSWKGLNAYAFPPFSVLTQVIRKAREEKPHLILIAPHWPTKPWFPLLKSLSQQEFRLPPSSIFLPQDPLREHRLGQALTLMAYRL
jgi:hypothetical protein